MKKFIIALLLLIFALTIVSCGSSDFKETTVIYRDPLGRQVIHATYIENIGEYTVVRSDTSENEIKDIATEFRKTISDFCGSQLKIGTDYGSKSKYEILIGNTNRPESKNAMKGLGLNDYVIKLDGTKIVIAGGSNAAIKTAIDEFCDNFMYKNMVVVPEGDGLVYVHNFKLNLIKIEDKDASEYKIYSINPDASALLAQKIFDEYTGQTVEVAKEMEAGQNYIILEPTSLDYAPFKAEVKDGNLYVSGSYKSCTEFPEYFAKKGEKNVNIKGSVEGELEMPTFYTKDELMAVLETVYNEETVILGEQVNSYSEIGTPSDVLKRFYKASGKYPGIIGVDIGGYGLKLTGEQCPDYIKSQVFCEFVDYAAQGGIIQLHTHMAMPTEIWDPENQVFRSALDGAEAWAEVVTEGTALNETFKKALQIEGEYIKLFDDLGIPVTWRPFHEMNANWFWWGVSVNGKTIDASYFSDLWIYMYEYYEKMGLDDIVWVYSPNNANGFIDVMYTYPGDDYVDIVGLDWYTDGAYEIDGSGRSYAKLMNTEKITNICEFGIGGDIQCDERDIQKRTFSCLDFENTVKQMFSDGYKLAYILTWTAQDSIDWWGYGEEMMAGGTFIDRDTLPKYFEAVRAK
ncbi:MAG: hypothetical protein IKJ91_01545 [Clostridia bacterium]|nr:hypothetical protein [Clostridia bacterium]